MKKQTLDLQQNNFDPEEEEFIESGEDEQKNQIDNGL